jgi:hypothetical protein
MTYYGAGLKNPETNQTVLPNTTFKFRSPFPAGLFQYEKVTWSGAGLVNPKFYPTLSKIETRKLQEADSGWLISATTSSLNYRRGATPITHSKRPGEPYSVCFVSPPYTSYPLPACLNLHLSGTGFGHGAPV